MPDAEILSAPLVIEYAFTRTVGPVQSAFLTGLREQVMLGIRTADGRVMCPPVEYDPVTGDDLTELVELGQAGTVTTWSWEPEPRPNQPLDRPFAWALVRLDGADTALLHAVDAGSPRAMSTGMRVRIRWAGEREGTIRDIACFEPVTDEAPR
ncbi:MAG TPA: OB-fold domain-containing protein [Acidimicrobiales bacterium]